MAAGLPRLRGDGPLFGIDKTGVLGAAAPLRQALRLVVVWLAIAVVLCPSKSRRTCVPTPEAAARVITVRRRLCNLASSMPATVAISTK